MATGNWWTFRITKPGATEQKTQTVGTLEDVGGAKAGTMAYRVTTVKQSGTVTSWQQDTGTSVLRQRERDMAGSTQTDEIYAPYKLRVEEAPDRLVVGATWTETYDELVTDLSTNLTTTTGKTETWTVESLTEPVTVPAGTFCAMLIHRISMATSGGSDKRYWFVRGVGKVKETATNRTEELSDFSIASQR